MGILYVIDMINDSQAQDKTVVKIISRDFRREKSWRTDLHILIKKEMQ